MLSQRVLQHVSRRLPGRSFSAAPASWNSGHHVLRTVSSTAPVSSFSQQQQQTVFRGQRGFAAAPKRAASKKAAATATPDRDILAEMDGKFIGATVDFTKDLDFLKVKNQPANV